MNSSIVALAGALGSFAFFGSIAFTVWVEYRKNKNDRDAAHAERMKALELGLSLPDAEIERAKAYASAATSAGLVGILVPIAVLAVTLAGTIVAILNSKMGESHLVLFITAWSIAGVIVLTAVVQCLGVIRGLPRPSVETSPRGISTEKQMSSTSSDL